MSGKDALSGRSLCQGSGSKLSEGYTGTWKDVAVMSSVRQAGMTPH